MASNTDIYRSARDQLVDLIRDYDKAVETFSFPRLTGAFNWATDWFDVIARGNDRTALWIVEEDGGEQKISFAEMAERSDRVATWLAELGVGKGDRVILMLGNQVELWEAMLAVAKLGAIIMPTTGALGSADLVDRITRGGAKFVIANAADTAKFDDVARRLHPHRGRRLGRRLAQLRRRLRGPIGGAVHRSTNIDDPMLIYFTSGTTSKPKLVEHSQVSYPVGHLSTMAWIGVRPGDVHLAISSPGWAKHAWSCFFAPWIAEATIFVYNYARFDAAALLNQLRRAGVNTFCAPPTVWRMLIQSDLGPKPEGLREILGAGEPLNPDVIAQVERAWGLTIRDGFGQTETTLQVGNTPGQPVKPGSMGRPMPGVPVVLVDPLTGEPADEGEICLDLQGNPVNLMTGYLGDPQRNDAVMAGGYYHTGDVAQPRRRRLHHLHRSNRRRVQVVGLQGVTVRTGERVDRASGGGRGGRRAAARRDPAARCRRRTSRWRTAGSRTPKPRRQIMEYARDHLAPYLKVRRVEFYELPKTISGKIRRVELRRREDDAHADGTPIETEHRYEDLVDR